MCACLILLKSGLVWEWALEHLHGTAKEEKKIFRVGPCSVIAWTHFLTGPLVRPGFYLLLECSPSNTSYNMSTCSNPQMAFHLTHDTRGNQAPKKPTRRIPEHFPPSVRPSTICTGGSQHPPPTFTAFKPHWLSRCSSIHQACAPPWGASGLDAPDPSRTLSPRHPLLTTCSTLRWVTVCPATPLHSRNVSSMERPLWSVFFLLYLQCSLQPPAHSRCSVNVCGMTE